MEDMVNQAVNNGTEEKFISSRVGRLTESQKFAQNIVVRLLKKTTFTASITEPFERRAETAVMNEAKFFNQKYKCWGSEKEATAPSTLSRSSPASSYASKHDRRRQSKKKIKAYHSSGSSYIKSGWSKGSSEDYEVDCHGKVVKSSTVLQPVDSYFTRVLNFNTYNFDMQLQEYDGRISCMLAKKAK